MIATVISPDLIAEEDRAALMDVIRAELYTLDRGELERLARRIERSPDCLAKIRAGTTVWPRPGTLFALAHQFGLKLVFVPADEAALHRVTPKVKVVHLTRETRVHH